MESSLRGEIRTLVLIRSQFKPKPAFAFHLIKNLHFIKKFKRFDISLKMKKMGDGCEEVKMAQFWDCNPYVSVNHDVC
jgi:hypothetical protein